MNGASWSVLNSSDVKIGNALFSPSTQNELSIEFDSFQDRTIYYFNQIEKATLHGDVNGIGTPDLALSFHRYSFHK